MRCCFVRSIIIAGPGRVFVSRGASRSSIRTFSSIHTSAIANFQSLFITRTVLHPGTRSISSTTKTKMSSTIGVGPYAFEQRVALSAVRRACGLTSSVFETLVLGKATQKGKETLTKIDSSPVTVGDFAGQALISHILSKTFSDDPIVGEEDSSELRTGEPGMRERITGLVNAAIVPRLHLSSFGGAEGSDWGLGPGHELSEGQVLDSIDRGSFEGGRTGRMWCIDPIDGTKGFLRGEQYAVCLALIVDGVVQLGVIGCPNLPSDPNADLKDDTVEKGCIFSALRGHGAFQLSLDLSTCKPLTLAPSVPPEQVAFLESVESSHSSHSTNAMVANSLSITASSIRMDSQAKYGCLARGQGSIYLRIPVPPKEGKGEYVEKIWDHAPGSVIVSEAGGVVSDAEGKPLDFGLGRTLNGNRGVVGAGKGVHGKVIDVLKEVWGSKL